MEVMVHNIVSEMVKGNFSFLILAVGIVQTCVMIRNNIKNRDGN